MTTRTKVRKNTTASPRVQAADIWRKLRGLLLHKGPKHVTSWQRRGRKDRKIL